MIHVHVFNATDIEIHHSVCLKTSWMSKSNRNFPSSNLWYILLSYLFLSCSIEEKAWTKGIPVLPEKANTNLITLSPPEVQLCCVCDRGEQIEKPLIGGCSKHNLSVGQKITCTLIEVLFQLFHSHFKHTFKQVIPDIRSSSGWPGRYGVLVKAESGIA